MDTRTLVVQLALTPEPTVQAALRQAFVLADCANVTLRDNVLNRGGHDEMPLFVDPRDLQATMRALANISEAVRLLDQVGRRNRRRGAALPEHWG